MGVDNAHTIGAVVLDDETDVVFAGIESSRSNLGTEFRSDPLSGEPFSRFSSIIAQNPGAEFLTRNLDQLFTNIPVIGLPIENLATGVAMYLTKLLQGSTRATGSSHKVLTATQGLMALTRLTCQHQGDANCAVGILPTYDGSNEPLVKSSAAALPTLAGEERFTLGKAVLESNTLTGWSSLDIDFGLNIQVVGSDSDIWPTFAFIQDINPVITLRGLDVDWLQDTDNTPGTIPPEGLALTHANTALYLRKRASGGKYVADATLEHIKITFAGTAAVDQIHSGQSGAPAETVVVVRPIKGLGATPVVITVDQAIP
jgi:hypothetical protein